MRQRSCWIAYTSEEVHEALREGLQDSPPYNGQIKSIGHVTVPASKQRLSHLQIRPVTNFFLNRRERRPTILSQRILLSLPLETQLNALQRVPAFRNVHIFRPGYAIEYDFFDPTQLHPTLETKQVKNLFSQDKSTEPQVMKRQLDKASWQASTHTHNCHGGNPFVLHRVEAYIGVLIDDLVTKGVDEPYRMFTSRAEYRILLRQVMPTKDLPAKQVNWDWQRSTDFSYSPGKKKK